MKNNLFKQSAFFFTVLLSCLFSTVTTASLYTFHNFKIPAQDMAGALTALSIQSGVQLVYRPELVEGMSTEEVEGYFPLEKVLRAFLESSDLEYELIDDDTLVIREAPTDEIFDTPIQTVDQDYSGQVEVVEVTGSRIPRAEYGTLYPATSIDMRYLEDTSYAIFADALESLPFMGNSQYSLDVSENFSNNGATFADLYGLSSQRTLTLINGRRVVSSNEPSVFVFERGLQVDLNTIPDVIIDRIDVIGVGGAPIYGSDAIAGTVNILLKEDFEGFEMDLQGGISDAGDAENYKLGALLGRNFSQGRGNVTVAYEYFTQNGVAASERDYSGSDFTLVPNPANTGPDDGVPDNILAEDLTVNMLTTGGIPAPFGEFPPLFALDFNVFVDAEGNPQAFGDDGRLRAMDTGEFLANPTFSSGGEGLRQSDFLDVRLPIERHSLNVLTDFDINPQLRLFGEVLYSSSESSVRNQNPRVNSGAAPPGTSSAIPISINNPFLHPQDRDLLIANGIDPAAGQFFLNKSFNDLAPAIDEGENELYRFVAGLEGQIYAGQREWFWDIALIHGRSKSETMIPDILEPNFRLAIDATLDGDGNIVCASGAPGCVPLDPFGLIQDQASIDYSSVETVVSGRVRQDVFTATIRGDTMELNGGNLAIAVGMEFREEAGLSKPDDVIRTGQARASAQPKIEGDYHTKELFAEFVAPIVGSGVIPSVQQVSLEGSWRGVDNSLAGTDSTWTMGSRIKFDLSAAGSLTWRGNYTQSIRSPSIAELFRPLSPAFVIPGADDPCDAQFVDLGPEPGQRRAACIAEAEALGAQYDPDTFSSLVVSTGLQILFGGNPDLKNERADSYSLGLVYEIGDTNRFSGAIDLFKIDIEDVIFDEGLEFAMVSCYDGNDAQRCGAVMRDPDTFQVTSYIDTRNGASRVLEAVQYSSQYDFSLPGNFIPGRFIYDVSAYYLRKLENTTSGLTTDLVGSLRNAKLRWYMGLSYLLGDLSVSWSTQYKDAVSPLEPLDPRVQESDEFYGVDEVDSYTTHNVAIKYALNDNLNVRFGIRNVLDADIPEGLPSFEGLRVTEYDVIGPYYNLAINYGF